MCTVTFLPRRRGYLLGMNRDEKLTRPVANPPKFQSVGGRQALFPSEPSGGTWIGVNDAGVTFALINWYAIKEKVSGEATSRGEVVRHLLAAATETEAADFFGSLHLRATNPFRVIGAFPTPGTIIEWRWNLSGLSWRRHDWKAGTWISSGYDEPGAQRTRGAAFRKALLASTAGRRDWLRRLHQSHGSECGPYSHCMHRPDAATVSYTEVQVGPQIATLRYYAGTPCSTLELTENYHDIAVPRRTGADKFDSRGKSDPILAEE